MEQKSIKNGKKPLSTKQRYITPDEVFGSQSDIPADVKAELKAKGLVGHWCNAKDIYDNGGVHKRGWIVYKRQKSDTINNSEFLRGNDPEGVVRRGDLILGVKTEEQVELHKQYLRQKSERAGNINRQKADELRQFAKEANLSATIHEGYEENED